MQVYSLTFDEKFVRPVLDNKVSKVVQFSFPKGKVLEKHRTTSHILVQVISGKVRFSTDEAVDLVAGQLLSLEPNVEHSVQALEDSVMLLTQTPSPSTPKYARPSEAERHTFGPEAKQSIAPQLRSFVEEHEALLQVLQKAVDQHGEQAYREADRVIAEELNQHFRYEEEILFPLLGKYIGTNIGPIAVMLAEHKAIRDLHNTFHQLRESGANQSDVSEAFEPLEELLRTHITKEDNVLFPMASNVMSEEDKNEVERRVRQESLR